MAFASPVLPFKFNTENAILFTCRFTKFTLNKFSIKLILKINLSHRKASDNEFYRPKGAKMKLVFNEINKNFELGVEITCVLGQVSTLMLALANKHESIDDKERLNATYLLSGILLDIASTLDDYALKDTKATKEQRK